MPDDRTPIVLYDFRWCRREGWTGGNWFPCAVFTREDGSLMILANGLGDGPIDDRTEGVTVGPRIPSPDRLAAMEKVCAASPLHSTAWECDGWACPHCNVMIDNGKRDEAGKYVELEECDLVHAPSCPWLRAQETKQ